MMYMVFTEAIAPHAVGRRQDVAAGDQGAPAVNLQHNAELQGEEGYTLYKASLTDLHDVSAFLGDLLYDSVPGGELGAGGVAVVEDGAGADPGEAAAVQLVGGAGGGQQ